MVVVSVNIGTAQPNPHNPAVQTGIYKLPVDQLEATVDGVIGDAVCNRRHHGGPDKALCVYCVDHLDHWRRAFPDRTWEPGSFGENLSLTSLDETRAHIGDTFAIGGALVQVSQPRGPCNTLAGRHGVRDFVRIVIGSGFTGWYFRVLEPGVIRASDEVRRVEADLAAMSIDRANTIRYAEEPRQEEIDALLAIPSLSAAWRQDLSELRRTVADG